MALMSWATHMLQWRIQRVANSREEANPIKVRLSSDCRLQLACMKLESLVSRISYAAVNTFPGLAHTARHTTKVGLTRSSWANPFGRQVSKVRLVIGVKS